MIDHKMLFRMMSSCRETVTSTFVAYQRAQNNNIEKGRAGMVAHGYEETTEPGPLTADGREVIEEWGKRWALRPDVHAERLAQRFEAARKRPAEKEPEQPEIKESIAAAMCPQMIEGKPCGGSLNRRGVCPACVTGRMGYRYRYTCESCGCDIVTKEELR